MKIAVIGGGGLRTPLLVRGLTGSELPLAEIVLYDIDRTRLELMGRVADRWRRSVRLRCSGDVEEALRGADIVFSTIRVGGMEARARDERACVELGLLGQETVGAAGFALAMRNIPPLVTVARHMERLAPEATLIHFTNPAGLVTEAVRELTGVGSIGICDTPVELFDAVARLLGLDPSRCRFDYFGLNHLGWLREVLYEGRSQLERLWPRLGELYEASLFGAEFLRKLRLVPSEYLVFYYRADEAVERLKRAGKTRGEALMEMNERFLSELARGREDKIVLYERYLAEREGSYFELETGRRPSRAGAASGPRGYERVGVAVARAITLDTGQILPVNVENQGSLPELRADDVVEVPCTIGRSGARPLRAGPMPQAVGELVEKVKRYERLTIRAARDGVRRSRIEALAAHPLVDEEELAGRLLEKLQIP